MGKGRNLKPFTVEVDGLPRIFFMVDVDLIPPQRQVYYDYSDRRKSIITGNEWLFVNNADSSDDDEGKIIFLLIHNVEIRLKY
jgi:hypothetical protein